jgi:hypothetical protein
MARGLIIITGALWGLLLFIGVQLEDTQFALAPLAGLYPGNINSVEPGSGAICFILWNIICAVVFGSLGFLASRFRSELAAVGFLALFLASTVLYLVRTLDPHMNC